MKILYTAFNGKDNSSKILLDKIMGSSEAIRTIVIYFFIAHEGLVILKNWCKMGLPLPKKIYSTLEGLLGEEEENGNTIERQEECFKRRKTLFN